VQRFFDALVAGDTRRLMNFGSRNPAIECRTFLTDWGPHGYYGPVKSYKIIKISSPKDSSNSVAVEVCGQPVCSDGGCLGTRKRAEDANRDDLDEYRG